MEKIKTINHFVSMYCNGEKCKICKADATHKLEETIFDDEPNPQINGFSMRRHHFTVYVCCNCFRIIMGKGVLCD